MSIIKSYQKNDRDFQLKKNYNILIDLDSLCKIHESYKIIFHPCRLKAVNSLHENGHIITIFTSIGEDKKQIILPQLINLKYHKIKFGFEDVDFIVSYKSREQVPFFNELFDRNYKIEPLPYLISYDYH